MMEFKYQPSIKPHQHNKYKMGQGLEFVKNQIELHQKKTGTPDVKLSQIHVYDKYPNCFYYENVLVATITSTTPYLTIKMDDRYGGKVYKDI